MPFTTKVFQSNHYTTKFKTVVVVYILSISKKSINKRIENKRAAEPQG